MRNLTNCLFFFFFHSLLGLLLLTILSSVDANSISLKPQESAYASPFSIITATTTSHSQLNQTIAAVAASCSYTVTITTSCSSPKYTRDQISLSMGDSFGNQVNAPRIDDPSSGAFERCSVDTYDISGPCLYEVCYLYLYRSGYDGWMPESVQVDSYYTGTSTFFYDTYIPAQIWYGFNYCQNPRPSGSSSMFVASKSLPILVFMAFLLVAIFNIEAA
ncbi:embryo-specific protein ATS3B-like [Impatiens glandulifera]|uniref:embryo-specific protein ATS3B-like n=1 Tax=Impatiens glandulifera TaxID=253017 RepID=UPI001FB0F506|nr:embryo-specific protein ATS3B-like [Impatiens glandulifera]